MNRRIFMPCEPEKPHFALPLGFEQGLRRSIWSKYQVRIVLVDDLVYLPHVEMISLQASQRFFKLAHGDILVASMRTDLRHHDGAVPPALECATQPLLAQALMIFPGIVEEVHAGIQRLIYDLGGFSLAVHRAQVISANS